MIDRLLKFLDDTDEEIALLQVQLEGASSHAEHLKLSGQVRHKQQCRKDAATLLERLQS